MSTSRRPRTIEELAELATPKTYDPKRDLKDQLRAADHVRRQGKEAERNGDVESAFVHTARAATIILDKIPVHSEFDTLDREQKKALAANGQDLLKKLEALKRQINDAHERWVASGGEAAEALAAEREEEERQRAEEERERRRRRRKQEEERARQQEEEMYRRRDAEERERSYRRKQEDKEREMRALDAARIASEQARLQRQQEADDYYHSARRRDHERQAARDRKQQNVFADVNAAAGIDYPPARISRGPVDSPPSQRSTQAMYDPSSSSIQYPAVHPSQISYVTPPKRDNVGFSSPGPLPLESPSHNQYRDPMDSNDYLYLNDPSNRPSYPGLVTTSSPPQRNQAPIEYPQLMNPHQQQQGYIPSASGMFMDPSLMFVEPAPSRSLASFPTAPLSYPQLPAAATSPYAYYTQAPAASPLNGLQRAPSIPALAYTPPRQNSGSRSAVSAPGYPVMPNPVPVPPRPAKVPISPPRLSSQSSRRKSSTPPRFSTDSAERHDSPEPFSPAEVASPPPKSGLCTVYLPADTLPKFMQIAAVNTARKVETCGLLLGRKSKNSYTVQSLLIPRQTSDENSCTMTHEELVFEFQEGRDLLTLGWIHTHPTQSCFMSSLDLHTHSAFQAMLPEAFAIVCAPKSTPSFGIFRLTDPPGLQIIMECQDQRSFHPHPDKPIYTDADSGHVRMVPELPLEISDLRKDF